MKKILSLFILTLLVALLCSCATPSSPNEEQDDSSQNEAIDSDDALEEPEQPDLEDFNPFSQEFSLLIQGETLSFGQQTGNFPWGTSVQEQESKVWRSDGFDGLEIICQDGTVLGGLRAEGMSDATDGFILSMKTTNPSYQTYRGVQVGMSLEDVLAYYPEAVYRNNTDSGENSYSYSSESSGLSVIIFYFEEDALIAITIQNEIDG